MRSAEVKASTALVSLIHFESVKVDPALVSRREHTLAGPEQIEPLDRYGGPRRLEDCKTTYVTAGSDAW
jgi:hypothetical protein